MKKTILVDIGIITEYLKTGKGVLPNAYERYKMQIASTTYTELLASTTFSDESLETEVRDFIKKYFEVLNVTEEIAIEAAKYVRNNDLALASAIVVAAAMLGGLELLSADKDAFSKVEGIKMLDM